MGLGVIELAVIVAVVAIIARSPHGWRTTGVLCGIGLVLFIGVVAMYRSVEHEVVPGADAQGIDYSISAESAAALGHSQYAPLPASVESFGMITLSWMLLVVAFGMAIVVGRRAGIRGAAVASSLLAIAAGLFFVRSSVRTPQPTPWPPANLTQDAVHSAWHGDGRFEGVVELDHGQAPRGGSAPIDELYERFSAPRIPLDEPKAAEQTAPVADAAGPAAAVDPFAHATAAETRSAGDEAEDERSAATAAASHAEETADHAHGEQGDPVKPEESDSHAHASTPRAAHAEAHAGAAPERPDWVDQPTQVVGNVRRVVVEAGPYPTLRECTTELHREIDRAVHQRIQALAHARAQRSVYVPELEWLPLDPDFALRELLSEQHAQHNDTSMGRFVTCWALLEFTPEHDERLLAAWKSYARRDGIATTLVISLVVLSIVGGVWLLLKLDTWTRGYYTKRLFLGVPAVIIVLLMMLAAAA